MSRQSTGSPFLERILRGGKKRQGLLDMSASGGVGVPSPTGLGSGQGPPPRPTPAADISEMVPPTPAPAAPPEAAPVAGPEGAPAPAAPPEPTQAMPLLEEEFPSSTLFESDGERAGRTVLRAPSLRERFYRVYGRLPTDVETYILHLRDRYEKQLGRAPVLGELHSEIERMYEVRRDEPL